MKTLYDGRATLDNRDVHRAAQGGRLMGLRILMASHRLKLYNRNINRDKDGARDHLRPGVVGSNLSQKWRQPLSYNSLSSIETRIFSSLTSSRFSPDIPFTTKQCRKRLAFHFPHQCGFVGPNASWKRKAREMGLAWVFPVGQTWGRLLCPVSSNLERQLAQRRNTTRDGALCA